MAPIPKYKITIDSEYASDGQDLGIDKIAFTSNPAIMIKGMAFKADKPKKLTFSDNVKMRIAAPALIPMDIYRNDEDGEYFVQFTEDEIEKIHSKFMRDLVNKDLFNAEHDNLDGQPAYILEAWIVDKPKEDKSFTTFGIEVPKGSLFVVSQVTDKTAYQSLVDNGQVGYSIEGFLGMKMSDLISKYKKNEQIKMKKKIFTQHTRGNMKGFELTTINEVSQWAMDVDNTTFNVGDVVTMTDDKGNVCPITDGQYFLEDGSSFFTNVSGKIVLLLPAGSTTDATDASTTPAPAADASTTPAETTPTPDATKMAAQTEMATPPAAGTTPAATETDTKEANVDEAQILAIMQPKLDEIYKMIADLKAAIAADNASEDGTTDATDGTSAKLTADKKYEKLTSVISGWVKEK